MNVKKSVCLTAVILFYSGVCRAEHRAYLNYMIYNDNNKVTVRTDSLDLYFSAGKNTGISVGAIIDAITAASRGLPIYDGVTSATPSAQSARTEYKNRYSVGISHRFRGTSGSVSLNNGKEDDYQSSSYALSVTQEFGYRDIAVKAGYSGANDILIPYNMGWRDTVTSKKYEISLSGKVTQESRLRLNMAYGINDGYLDNPYHRVVVNNFYYKERHPTVRDSFTFSIFYDLAFFGKKSSFWQLDYHYYMDNWKIKSNTCGLRHGRYLTGRIMAFLRGRYQVQNGAYFFKNSYEAEERFMTSEIKLAPMSAISYGGGINYSLSASMEFELNYDQYNQYTNLDYIRFYEAIAKTDLRSGFLYLRGVYNF